MEHYGILGIIPPLLAIILALVTKEYLQLLQYSQIKLPR